MWKKIFYSFLALFVLILAVGGFLYWRMTEKSKPPISDLDRARLTIMPLPAKVTLADESLFIDAFQYHFKVNRDTRVEKALARMLEVLSISGSEMNTENEANLIIDFHHETDSVQHAFEDEAYTIEIDDKSIRLVSENAYGILRGIESLKQLASQKDKSIAFIHGKIEDQPRYPWRGIMIDAGRHFIPKEIILRNLDAMAAMKLNVLHWHLSEYQGFRIESKVFPKLHELGSNGLYYTQEEVKEIIAYARDRGIRVVPEFDMPGHSTSWFVGYPELATTQKKYVSDIKYGVLTPVMDPTRESVYEFLDKFIGDMAGLFPDEYFHIGGDEVSPEEWNASDSVQIFMKNNGIKDMHGLQQYFNKRVTAIAKKYNKIVMGWDEVLYPGADTTMVVHAWRGGRKLWEAAQAGHPTILSAGFYLDHKLPAGKHYQVDPEVIPGAITIKPDSAHWKEWNVKLLVSDSPMDAKLVLYGEAPELRGVFQLMENATGIEKAILKDNNLEFSFPSDYGTINVSAGVQGDSLNGTMSSSLLSFPFKAKRITGDDMPGTRAPVFEEIKPLSDLDRKKILGGEAAMWTEFVSADNIDSRIWPRSAAIAEKLWSPQLLTKNLDDMYRRLGIVDNYLQRIGVWHHKGQDSIVSKWNVNPEDETLRWFLSNVEEVKYYQRLTSFTSSTTLTPLDQVVDAALPESLEAHNFNDAVTKFINDSSHVTNEKTVRDYLEYVSNNHVAFEALAKDRPALQKVVPISANLSEMAKLGLSELMRIGQDKPSTETERHEKLKKLEELSTSLEGIEIAITPGIKALVNCK
jgi:hexosaminidase